MLVIAHHFIQNAESFWSTAQKLMADNAMPKNLQLHSVFPSVDGKTGTCLWEAKDTSDVQNWLDTTFGNDARNVTYQVDEQGAIGLPQKMTAAAFS